MPSYDVNVPGSGKFRVNSPVDLTDDQVWSALQEQLSAGPIAPAGPKEGIGSAFTGGFKRFGSELETALESIINPQRAAERGLEREQKISEQYGPGASLERVKKVYEEKGLFPAAGEALSQMPAALAEQAPNFVTAYGGARLGAMAGAPAGPLGALIGGGLGAAAAAYPQIYAAGLQRQAQEGKPVDAAAAALSAIPGAALEVVSEYIPLGRGLIGKILGPGAEKALAKGTDEAIERAAKESLMGSITKGAGVGALAEIPTEVAQQMLERYQAGLPLTTDDALAEYGEAAYGAGLVGAPFGAIGRTIGRPAARAEFEDLQMRKQQELAGMMPAEPVATLPGGFTIDRMETGRSMVPQTFNITMPGSDTPLASYDTEQEAQDKLPRLQQIRQDELATVSREIEDLKDTLQEKYDRLDYLEATGQTQTEEYQALKQNLPTLRDQTDDKIGELFKRQEEYQQPLQVQPAGEREQINEQFILKNKKGEEVGTFPSLQDATTALREQMGDKAFEQAQERTEQMKELHKQLIPALQKFGLKDVGLKIVDDIENAEGAYSNKLIEIAMKQDNPLQTLRHEAVHALKDMGFFTPQQWRALEERAKKEWIKTYLEGQETEIDDEKMSRLEGYKKKGLSDQDIIEEAIADAFAAYDKGETPPPGLIASLFKKLKNFFANFGQALRGAGFESADDIFQKIERGELKATLPKPISAETGEVKYSQAPEGIPQKIWDLHEKLRLAEDESTGRVTPVGVGGRGKAPGALKRNQTMSFRRLNNAVMDFVGGDEQKAMDLMVQMNQESGRREEEKLSLKHVKQVAKQLKVEPDLLANTSIPLQTGKTGQDQFKTKVVGGLPEVVQYLENRRRETGTPILDISKPEDREIISDLMAAEAMASINAGGSALSWYDETIARTIGMAALKYPELNTDQNARMAFKIATAIASQGLNVEDNLTFADKQYNSYRKSKKATGVGQFDEIGSGADAGAMVSNYKLANKMIKDYGEDAVRKFLQTEFKVEELRAAGFKITGELGDETVTGSAIFGPKIGFGFYSNLSGNFEPVTMDMWFMRLVGRLTGKLKEFDQELFNDQLKRFRNAFEQSGEDGIYADEFKPEVLERAKTDEAAAIELARVVNSAFNSDFINNRGLYDGEGRKKTELVYAAQSIIGSVDAPKDAPKNGTERRQLRDIVSKTVSKVEKAYGKRIPPAALQALVWYPEQELYKKLGVKLRVTSQDYAGAMEKILRKDGYSEQSISSASQSGARQLQRMAVQPVQPANQQAGQQPTATFGKEEREGFLEKARTKTIVEQEREQPKLHKVVFEVAPDPNNVELTDQWRNLDQKTRLEISERVARNILKKAMADLEIDGVVTNQVGSYIDDTNPSFAFFLKKGNPVEVAKYLGFALSQDSMVALSPRPAPGLSQVGAVVVDVKSQSPSEIDSLYQKLREIRVNGEQPVGGQSTMNNKMILLNYSNVPTEELANLIDAKLGGSYNVQTTDVYSAYPEKKDYDYASEQNDPKGKAGVIRQRARALRAEATNELAKEIGQIPAAAGQAQPEEKLSLRQAPASHPLLMYHSTFSDFTTPKTNYGDKEYKQWGFHVGSIEAAENRLGIKENEDRREGVRSGGAGANIMPVYVSAKNPLRLDENRTGRWGVDDIMNAVMEKAEKSGIDGISDKDIDDFFSDKFDIDEWLNVDEKPTEVARSWSDVNDWQPGERSDALKYFLQRLGYDSIVYKNDFEGGGDSYILFKPNQIKSAIGNVGTYSPKTGDIRYSLKKTSFATPEAAERAAYKKAPPETKEFKLFFGGSTIKEEGRPQVMYHASPNEFETFSERKPIFVSPDADKAQSFSALKRLGTGAKRDYIYPLWVRAETPFDYENDVHVQNVVQYLQQNHAGGPEVAGRIKLGTEGPKTVEQILEEIKNGVWRTIEAAPVQEALKSLGFDSFYVYEGNTKNLAVFGGNQVKSATGNIGEFSRDTKDIRYSLRKFDSDDLPKKDAPFTLPENTMIFHGAHKEAAQKIKDAGHVLLSYPGVKTSGGTLDEGGLIFFGDEETASNFANQRADLMSVEAARERGETRLPGTVFETATDRPYRLMSRYHKLTKQQADALNKALGIPDYKPLKAGDYANTAASRAYTNSNTIKREKIPNKGEMASPWPVIFKTLGFDGFYDNHNAPAIALTADNGIRLIGDDGKLVKYSLPKISQGAQDAIDRVTSVREQKGFANRILDALSPKNFSHYRQQALNRYEALSVADKLRAKKLGNVALMADQSAEAAALMSDLHSGVAASVFGIQGRRGGVPVLKNGMTMVDHTKKGLVEVLSPLAKYGDPKVFQYFQFYSAVKRGARLFAEGRERLITPADQQHANELLQKFPEFEAIRKDWVEFNNGVTDYLRQTGVLSAADAQRFKEYADYIPFYRQLEGENTLGPNIFQSLSGVKKPKKLEGGTAPLADFMETVVRNTHAAITAGMKNMAEKQAIKVGKDVGIVNDIAPGANVGEFEKIKVLIDGVKHEYQCTDPMFIEATRSLHMPDLPFMSFLSAPANLLRNVVTRDPGFIMTNLLRDSVSAYVTSGANITPIAGTVINFAKAMKGQSPAFEALMDAGIIGGYEFSANIEQSGQKLTADLMKKAGKGPAALKPFTALWDGLEHATTASDAATRMAVYERVLAETGNEAEALYRALEVMNFNRKGSSAVVRILTAAVPFLNARMQGLDLFYRAITGKMNMRDAKEIQEKFFKRGMMILGLSTLYYFAVAGNPDYEKQEQETKDNNWIVPGAGIRIPIPFEVGILFKTIPERIAAYTFGNDTGKDFLAAMNRAANGFIPVSPSAYIPQTFKPIIEAMTNYNFFTQREIVGMGLKDVAPQYQVGPGTSAFAEFVGKTLGLSPLKVDHVFKGYTGAMGMYAVDLMDSVMDLNSDSPKPTKRFEQMPIIKRFALDPEARGNVTKYYELKDSVDTAVRTMNLLEKSGDPKEFAKYVQENAGTLAFKSYVSELEKSMKELRDMRKQVLNSGMTGDQKRDINKAIGQAENNLSANIQTVKKTIASI